MPVSPISSRLTLVPPSTIDTGRLSGQPAADNKGREEQDRGISYGARLLIRSPKWLAEKRLRKTKGQYLALDDLQRRISSQQLELALMDDDHVFYRAQDLEGDADAVLVFRRDYLRSDNPSYDLATVEMAMHQQPTELISHTGGKFENKADPRWKSIAATVLSSTLLPGGGIINPHSLNWLQTDLNLTATNAQIKPGIEQLLAQIRKGVGLEALPRSGVPGSRQFAVKGLFATPNATPATAELSFAEDPDIRHTFHLTDVTLHQRNIDGGAITLRNPEPPARRQNITIGSQVTLRQMALLQQARLGKTLTSAVKRKRNEGVDAPTKSGNTVEFRGQRYIATAVAENQFVDSLRPVRTAKVRRYNPAVSINKSAAPAVGGVTDAKQHMELAKSKLLNNDPARLKDLQSKTRDAIARFATHSEHPFKDELTEAMFNYVSPSTGYYTLMNGILAGHTALDDFLKARDPQLYADDAAVEEYCEDHIQRFKGADDDEDEDESEEYRFTATDLKSVFDSDLQEQTSALNDFLAKDGIDLTGITLAHGVETGADCEKFSVGVNGKAYLTAFIEGHLLHYKSFLSTTTNLETALDFTGATNFKGKLLGTVDLADNSERGTLRKQALLATLNDPSNHIDDKSVVLMVEGNRARGAFLGPETTEHKLNEQEVLLPPGHVVIPQRVIMGEQYYVLIGEIAPLDNAKIASRT